MAPLDDTGVWKKGRGKGRGTPKGRQTDPAAVADVQRLLGDRPRRRDLLIEFLHLIRTSTAISPPPICAALAAEMKLAMAEVYEVATFYAHFDVVKEGETPPPALTIRVCDSLSCELAGAQALKKALEDGLDAAKSACCARLAWAAAIPRRFWNRPRPYRPRDAGEGEIRHRFGRTPTRIFPTIRTSPPTARRAATRR